MESTNSQAALAGLRLQGYAILVFVAAILVSSFSSSDYSTTQVALIRLVGPFTTTGQGRLVLSYVGELIQLASLIVSVWAFYVIGKRVDFRHRCQSFVAIVLVGTFIGNAAAYFVYAPLAGQGWQTGFGSVETWGTGDLTSVLTIATASVASFMIPISGLALSSLRRDSRVGFQTSVPREGPSHRSFFVSAFLIAALAAPVSDEVYRVLGSITSRSGLIVIESFDPWQGLVSGYIGFLVYPVLLLTTFYFLGRDRTMSWSEAPRFGLRTFGAGAAGLLTGLILSVGIQNGWGVVGSFLVSDPLGNIIFLAVNGVLILTVGFASASLGMFRGSSGGAASTPARRRSFIPILVSLFLVAVVATAAVASYAYVLDPALSVSGYSCVYQPGQAFYLKIESDQSQIPISGQPVTAQLVSACPIFTVCVVGTGGPPCSVGTRVIRTLGSWDFVTNSTGYVSIPSGSLGGSDLWLSLAYLGHDYQARYQICGGGVTFASLSLPSGALSGQEVPSGNAGEGTGSMTNGTQFSTGCNPASFTGNATIS